MTLEKAGASTLYPAALPLYRARWVRAWRKRVAPQTYAPTIRPSSPAAMSLRDKRKLPHGVAHGHQHECAILQGDCGHRLHSEMRRTGPREEDALPEGGIRSFYGPFTRPLEVRRRHRKGGIKDEVSDVPATNGANDGLQDGAYEVPGLPELPGVPEPKRSDYVDPLSQVRGRLMEKSSRKGSRFLSLYYRSATSSLGYGGRPALPVCGGFMVFKQNKKAKRWHLCANGLPPSHPTPGRRAEMDENETRLRDRRGTGRVRGRMAARPAGRAGQLFDMKPGKRSPPMQPPPLLRSWSAPTPCARSGSTMLPACSRRKCEAGQPSSGSRGPKPLACRRRAGR